MREKFGLIVVFLAESRWTDARLLRKEAREIGVLVEAETAGYLLHGIGGIGQFALHQQRDLASDVLARGKSDGGGDDFVQVARRDVETVGIERGLAALGDVAAAASANALVAAGINKSIDAIKKKYATGYFVRCFAYLFQLEYDEKTMNSFYENYWDNPTAYANANYTLKYLGRSSGRARARKADDGNIIGVALQRATDKCYAHLQRDNEQFRPLSALHEVDGKLVAYIGTKEGVTEKSVFDVFEMQLEKDKSGESYKQVYKKIGSLKVQKGCVWDNQAGAGEADQAEADDDEDAKGDASLTYTTFVGKPGKFGEGHFIKLSK